MKPESVCSATLRLTLIAIAAAVTTPATATISYDYENEWMYDSASALYWQMLPVPTATFIPSTGTIATDQQLNSMFSDAGLENWLDLTPHPGPYSPQLANLMSFFQSGTPAPDPEPFREPSQKIVALYSYPPDSPPGQFEYAILSYSATDPSGSNWVFSGFSTTGSYGPPPGAVACPNNDHNCPATEPAFVVSTVQPTPLSPALWLLLSGLGLVEFLRRGGATGLRRDV